MKTPRCLKALNPNVPDNAKDVILLGENDDGKNAKAIAKAASDLKQKGVCVRVAMPSAASRTTTPW